MNRAISRPTAAVRMQIALKCHSACGIQKKQQSKRVVCKMGRTNSPAVDDCSSAFRVGGAGESCRLLPLAGKVRVANTRTTLLRVRVQFQPQVLPVNVPEKSGHMFSRVPGCVTTSKESRRRKATILIMLEPMFHRTTRILRGHP